MRLLKITLLTLALLPSCRSGSNNGGGDEAPQEDPEDEKYTEEIEEPSTSISGVNLVSFDSARARCLQKKVSDKVYSTSCFTVTREKNGEESVANRLADDIDSLDWAQPTIEQGSATVKSCQKSALSLRMDCEFTVTSSSTAISFELTVEGAEQSRKETDQVLLPYSLESSAGLVPYMPSIFKSSDEDLLNKKLPTQKEVDQMQVGFADQIIPSEKIGIGASYICKIGDDLYFDHGSSIFKLDKDGSVVIWAGSVNPANFTLTKSKRTIYLGKTLSLACHENSVFVLSEQVNSNLGFSFVRLVKLNESGSVEILAGGEYDPSFSDPNLVPNAGLGVDAVGADLRQTRGMHLVSSTEIHLVGNRVGTKLMIFDGSKIKKITLPTIDANGSAYQGFEDVTVFNGSIYLAAPDDHYVYRWTGSSLIRFAGDGTAGKVVSGSDLDTVDETPIHSPFNLSSFNNELYIVTAFGSIEKVDSNHIITTIFDNYEQAGPSDFTYLQTGIASTSKGNVNGIGTDGLYFSGNGTIRQISGTSISKLAGIPEFDDFSLESVKGKAAQYLLPKVNKASAHPDGGFSILDRHNNAVYFVSNDNVISHQVGDKLAASKTGSNPKDVLMPDPVAIAYLSNGDMVYALPHEIFKAVKGGGVVHLAGSGLSGSSTADGTTATAAKIGSITDIATFNDEIFFTEEVKDAGLSVGHRIMKIKDDKVYKVAGQEATSGDSPSGTLAVSAQINRPLALTLSSNGELYFVDDGNDKLRKIDGDGKIADLLADFKGIDISVAQNGQVFALELDGLFEVISTPTPALSRIYGGSPSPQCGSGNIRGKASPEELVKKLTGSLALVCAGDEMNSIDTSGSCSDGESTFSLILGQNFSYASNNSYGNVLSIELPCTP